MRTLLLLRHAKSSWTDPELSDHERPLAPRGARAARRMAEYINADDLAPDLVLCSSARRAMQTLELIRPSFGSSTPVVIERGIYEGDDHTLLAMIKQVDETVMRLMLIGHNPALEDLARSLAGDGDAAAVDQLAAKYPTAALAVLTVHNWKNLQRDGAFLTHVVVPRSLA